MEYRGLYVSATPDCEPNEGGYYCQVYADEDYGDQIDDFCIHPDELEENDDIKHLSLIHICVLIPRKTPELVEPSNL